MSSRTPLPVESCKCDCGLRGCASRRDLRPDDEVKRQRSGKTARRNAESRDKAINHGKEWTGPELELVARQDLTEAVVAEMLGRTRQAVSYQRRLLRAEDPTRTWLSGVPHGRQDGG